MICNEGIIDAVQPFGGRVTPLKQKMVSALLARVKSRDTYSAMLDTAVFPLKHINKTFQQYEQQQLRERYLRDRLFHYLLWASNVTSQRRQAAMR